MSGEQDTHEHPVDPAGVARAREGYVALEQWVKRTKDDLMKLLRYGKGKGFKEYRPLLSKVHPLERATTLFQCKECKRVNSICGRMAALDLKGLCLHECIQPARSRADRTKWSTCE